MLFLTSEDTELGEEKEEETEFSAFFYTPEFTEPYDDYAGYIQDLESTRCVRVRSAACPALTLTPSLIAAVASRRTCG